MRNKSPLFSFFILCFRAKNFFSIDPKSGQIKTTVSSLDRETLLKYEFLVVAQDQGVPHTLSGIATVVVALEDINDNAPKFAKSKYEVTIPENTSPKSFLSIKVILVTHDRGIPHRIV
jgi:hypothetical protein